LTISASGIPVSRASSETGLPGWYGDREWMWAGARLATLILIGRFLIVWAWFLGIIYLIDSVLDSSAACFPACCFMPITTAALCRFFLHVNFSKKYFD
jgi:hypothetical protein